MPHAGEPGLCGEAAEAHQELAHGEPCEVAGGELVLAP
ncbi:hypothetical protein SFR_1619 [Streptomyces sp. FR-008]|nr:hypothetical protein SFR_1619 [Streptomyces sp. FR-008]